MRNDGSPSSSVQFQNDISMWTLIGHIEIFNTEIDNTINYRYVDIDTIYRYIEHINPPPM